MTSATGRLGPQSIFILVSHGYNTLQHTARVRKSLVQALHLRKPSGSEARMTQIVVARHVWTSASTGRTALSVVFTQATDAKMTPSWPSANPNERSASSKRRSFSGCRYCASILKAAILLKLRSVCFDHQSSDPSQVAVDLPVSLSGFRPNRSAFMTET